MACGFKHLVVDMSEESQVAYMHNVVAVLAEKCGETVAQTFVEEEMAEAANASAARTSSTVS